MEYVASDTSNRACHGHSFYILDMYMQLIASERYCLEKYGKSSCFSGQIWPDYGLKVFV